MRWLMLGFLTLGCADVDAARSAARDEGRHITCYSGGQIIYEGDSSGRVINHTGGPSEWVDKKTGMYYRTYADCLYATTLPSGDH